MTRSHPRLHPKRSESAPRLRTCSIDPWLSLPHSNRARPLVQWKLTTQRWGLDPLFPCPAFVGSDLEFRVQFKCWQGRQANQLAGSDHAVHQVDASG